jgi:hypothetical protein
VILPQARKGRTIPARRISSQRSAHQVIIRTVLLYAFLAVVAGANSYRQMHEFIRIHRQRLNEAFGFGLP